MTFLPMFENTPGMPDLVHHTVKHFLGRHERDAWDRVEAGRATASDAWSAIQRCVPGRLPPRGRFPATTWWSTPWIEQVRRAHNDGYGPRYMLLLSQVGDPTGARWQPAAKRRRITEHLGFRLVVEANGPHFQVVDAFWPTAYTSAADSMTGGPALRAFAARRGCPTAPSTGVNAGEGSS